MFVAGDPFPFVVVVVVVVVVSLILAVIGTPLCFITFVFSIISGKMEHLVFSDSI